MSFTGNVHPRKFGRTDRPKENWVCPCGEEHRPYLTKCHCMKHARSEGTPVSEKRGARREPDTAA